jgi:hypothetical protein
VKTSRRGFIGGAGAAGLLSFLGPGVGEEARRSRARSYQVCLCPDALDGDPQLLDIVRDAGVTEVWVTGFLYGHWYFPVTRTEGWLRRIEQKGMAAHVGNVPLGHPGDALGAKSGQVPLTPPRHWKLAMTPSGQPYAGTSLHAPAAAENVDAVRRLAGTGARRIFLDDDFRLARSPGMIGGCFCPEHREEFLRRHGYAEAEWRGLLDAVSHRSLTPVLRQWVEFTCDQLTALFRAMQDAAPKVQVGIMVMYLGAEKAGIRLADYRGALFRVGEMMFHDASFGQLQNKTNELFSSLFHRRFTRPELAFSETTAFPADQLSARNLAAKLAVSTISDVRHTLFMSGLTPFPREHWQTLGPAMRRQAAIHERLAGHAPRGPFKHFWGEHSRYVGDDNPYSLFLATGVPFEVTEKAAADGYTFLADADARGVQGSGQPSPGTTFVVRPGVAGPRPDMRAVAESLSSLFALKREMVPRLADVPYVEEDAPVVCAWYPTARAALLWNLAETRSTLTLRFRSTRRTVTVEALDVALVEQL